MIILTLQVVYQMSVVIERKKDETKNEGYEISYKL